MIAVDTPQDPQSGAPESKSTGSWRIWYVVALLTTAYTLSYVDRQVLSLLVGPIKASLGITDTEIGLIQTVSFSLFFLIATLPLARLADRGHRPRLMASCAAVWSAMTMLCGAASNMWGLMAARTGVAAAEAGLPPAAFTLMADQLDRSQLARATSLFMLAPFFGGGFALLFGGALYEVTAGWAMPTLPVLGEVERWQAVFFIVGAPGLVIALLLARLKEPREGRARVETRRQMGLKALAGFLHEQWMFTGVYILATALLVMLLNAQIVWMPASIMRAHGLSEGGLGKTFGLTYLIAGSVGTIIGGQIASRARTDLTARALKMMLTGAVVMTPCLIIAPMLHSLTLELVLVGLSVLCISGMLSVSSLPYQMTSPRPLRAQVIAIGGMAASLIGAGLGPLVVGILSDAFAGAEHPLSLALSVLALVVAPATVLCLIWVIRQHGKIRLDLVRLAENEAVAQGGDHERA